MTGTDRDRLEQALQVVRAQGVAVVFDLGGSSGVRGDDVADYLMAAVKADTDRWVGAHVGSDEHGGAFWDGHGVLRYRHDSSPVTEVWWSHNHRQPDAARLLVKTLTAAGLNVTWDGDTDYSVVLTLSPR